MKHIPYRFTLIIALCLSMAIFTACERRFEKEGEKKPQFSDIQEEMIASLFFLKQGRIYPEERGVVFESKDLNNKISKLFQELIQGPSEDLISPIPEGTEILNLFIDRDGILYLNFSQELKAKHPGGISSEQETASSIVFTAMRNFSEIKGVMILIDDEEQSTLAGHLDISRPLKIGEVFETPLGSL